jgi:predicted RNase H-like HicB family nuclease
MMHKIDIEAHLQWTEGQDEESGHLVACCEALNLVMSGVDREDLRTNIAETLNLFFAALLREGELDEFLQARGWRRSAVPAGIDQDDVEINVPWELVAASNRGSDGPKRAFH